MAAESREITSYSRCRSGHWWSCTCNRYVCLKRNSQKGLNSYDRSGLKQSGHDVIILEQVAHIAEVGAGIQMAPNAARILGRFGLLKKVIEKANMLEMNSLRRYANNEELGTAPLMPQVRDLRRYIPTLTNDFHVDWAEIRRSAFSNSQR